MNLGTPQTPAPRSIRRYLKEFLSDPRVVEAPRLLWWLVLNLVILPLRSRKVAKAYQDIWQAEGSPLRVIGQQQCNKLQQRLNQDLGQGRCFVSLAMTYGQPDVHSAWSELKTQGVDKIFILPLYPQYSATTTGAAFDQISRLFQQERVLPELRFCRDYASHPAYIEALARSVEQHWSAIEKTGQAPSTRFLLVSFHGIPQRCIDLGDPYYQQCLKTAQALAARLDLTSEQWQLSFQSRVGKAQWTGPYTDQSIAALAKKLKRLDVVCPGFAADCLETLEEIKQQNRALYEAAGGEGFGYIPALNSEDAHISLFAELVAEKCSDWIKNAEPPKNLPV